uniref:Uncharacterized protein n=1 Tax=uncultured Nitrospirae bacterium MY3-5B TaxID=798578 RepID=D9MP19_9BACT|nr:hypothetical protein LW3_0050 [uncultured Nitrospirae bacterium MY3-5B]
MQYCRYVPFFLIIWISSIDKSIRLLLYLIKAAYIHTSPGRGFYSNLYVCTVLIDTVT